MDLCGGWRASVADDELRRTFVDPAFDDSAWEPVGVPGHWRDEPAFATSDGPVLYRCAFWGPQPGEDERWWLALDGVAQQGDVWLDGAYVGDTEGWFVPHAFDVTAHLEGRREHTLGLEVSCGPQGMRGRRALTGTLQGWAPLGPGANPGGVWRPVRLERTGPVRIARLRVLCREADEGRAVLALRAELLADRARTVDVATSVRLSGSGPAVAERTDHHTLASGPNRVEWTVTVEDPRRWWPWSLGDQVLHDVTVAVRCGATSSHALTRRTGLRSVSLRNWVASVNGERLFLAGMAAGPPTASMASAGVDDVTAPVRAARELGLALVRVWGHVARPELYDEADRSGVLLWQDLPLWGGHARSVRRQAPDQAREMVGLLGHHPSVAVWCGHTDPRAGARRGIRRWVADQVPTWTTGVLTRGVRRSLHHADPWRPVVAASGVPPRLPRLDGADTARWFGWSQGGIDDLAAMARRWPRRARFVSAFGAQSVPPGPVAGEGGPWPDTGWAAVEASGADRAAFARVVPPDAYPSFDGWRRASQAVHAEVVRRQAEALRRIKYRPTGGFCVAYFADPAGVVGGGLVAGGVPRPAYAALAEAVRPVVVVADLLAPEVAPHTPVALDVHVVSDRRDPVDDAWVRATLTWPGGDHRWAWRGQVPPDASVRVGTVQFVVPDTPGVLELALELAAGDVHASNCYRARIGR